jgi:hypothetical protein
MLGAAPQLRTLAILKTAIGGWMVDDISGRHNPQFCPLIFEDALANLLAQTSHTRAVS